MKVPGGLISWNYDKQMLLDVVQKWRFVYNLNREVDSMIKRASEMVTELKHQMRGGNGTVEITHIFKQDELRGKARLFARITLNKGCSIGLHEHNGEEEIFYILSGKGIVNDNGSIKEVSAGDAVLTGNGASHSIENRSEEPLVMAAVILLYC